MSPLEASPSATHPQVSLSSRVPVHATVEVILAEDSARRRRTSVRLEAV